VAIFDGAGAARVASLPFRSHRRRSAALWATAQRGGSAAEEEGPPGYRGRLRALRRQTVRLVALATTWLSKALSSARLRRPARALVLMWLAWLAFSAARAKLAPVMATPVEPPTEIAWSAFLEALKRKKGEIAEIVVSGSRYDLVTANGERFYTLPVAVGSDVMELMTRAGCVVRAAPRAGISALTALTWAILIAYIAAMSSAARSLYRGGIGNVGRRARGGPEAEAITFDDVAGIGEARGEVEELRDLFASQRKYAKAGARAPKGILLVGPPGTGKTLLAKALATEAKVPFLYCSGSDFVEIFAGRGAARVRHLFARAAKLAPCIVFIDELDALGRARREGPGLSWNDESEQTLNQLLAAMDGVEPNRGIVVLAATNRLAVLDNALVRPGRFDRILQISPPDANGRAEILRVHAKSKNLAPDVDLDALAVSTPGFVGADLAALCNEAAIRAVRDQRDLITRADFYDALDSYFKTRKRPPSIIPPFF